MTRDGALRIYLGAFGDPGHAFPMLALGSELAARGHAVTLETWRRWREPAEQAGMAFVAAPEYPVFPTAERPLKPYAAAVRAAQETRAQLRAARPDLVVADILTIAPALAGEIEGVRVATLVPHVFPPTPPDMPPYGLGARPARTRAGRVAWRAAGRALGLGLRQGREQLNGARQRLGLPPVERLHGGISRTLCLVATLPQLEYPRDWPVGTHVVGPLMWEPPAPDVELPPGDDPLVLIAPSTSQDPEQRMLRAALAGLAELPVRVLASHNGRPPRNSLSVPANARLVDWVCYSRTMPHCDVVVCHGGHGTLARALSCGCALVVCPAAGDQFENAARVDWAGLGVRVPRRFVTPRSLRLALTRLLVDEAIPRRVRAAQEWVQAHDPTAQACALIERAANVPARRMPA